MAGAIANVLLANEASTTSRLLVTSSMDLGNEEGAGPSGGSITGVDGLDEGDSVLSEGSLSRRNSPGNSPSNSGSPGKRSAGSSNPKAVPLLAAAGSSSSVQTLKWVFM